MFGPYAFDAWLVLLDSSKRALATGAKPGTPEFRTALRDALVTAKDVVGTHGIYNFHAGHQLRRRRARAGAGEARRRQVEADAVILVSSPA